MAKVRPFTVLFNGIAGLSLNQSATRRLLSKSRIYSCHNDQEWSINTQVLKAVVGLLVKLIITMGKIHLKFPAVIRCATMQLCNLSMTII